MVNVKVCSFDVGITVESLHFSITATREVPQCDQRADRRPRSFSHQYAQAREEQAEGGRGIRGSTSDVPLQLENQADTDDPNDAIVIECLEYFKQVKARAA